MKLKRWIVKLFKKLLAFIKWVWDECRNWQTLLLLAGVCLVIGAPVWVGGILWFVFGLKWALAMAIGCLAFWWLPATPFFVLSITITLALKKWGRKILSKGAEVHKKGKRKLSSKKAKLKNHVRSRHSNRKEHKNKESDAENSERQSEI